ncbi:hypothetical protein GCM10022286_01010 [Gryllotalpicola daejeonensis]|uniref:Macro domain-containing protein n=1 Tax=Gryllotalpicola daejeonensis TaxID=993087 RepID=A0ABP7ZD73_9MICO
MADELDARSIAFPLISAGVYSWPLDDAVAAAVDTIRGARTRVDEVRIVAFQQHLFDLVEAAVEASA